MCEEQAGEEYDRQCVSRYDAFASDNKKYAERCTRPEQCKSVTCPGERFSGDSLLAFVKLGFLGHGANVNDQSNYESGNQANQKRVDTFCIGVHENPQKHAGQSILVQRETDIFHLRLIEYLAFGKEVFLGIREFWLTISIKCAGRPV